MTLVSVWYFQNSKILNTSNYILFLLGLTSILGDFVVAHTKLVSLQYRFDSATHSILASFSWYYVCLRDRRFPGPIQPIIEAGVCASLASLIDADFLLAATPLSFKYDTSLKQKLILHCSTFPLLFFVFLFAWSCFFRNETLKKISLIILTVFTTHHVRDATRSGFWFYPFGATPPLPYFAYFLLTLLIPIFISWLNKYATGNANCHHADKYNDKKQVVPTRSLLAIIIFFKLPGKLPAGSYFKDRNLTRFRSKKHLS